MLLKTILCLICIPTLCLAGEEKTFVHPTRIVVETSDKESVGPGFVRLDSTPAKDKSIEPWAMGNLWLYRVVHMDAAKRKDSPVKWVLLSLSKKQEIGKQTFYGFERTERFGKHPSSAMYWQVLDKDIIYSTADHAEVPGQPDRKHLTPWMHLSPKAGNTHDDRKPYPHEFTVISSTSKKVKTPAGTFDCVELMYFVYIPNEAEPSTPGKYDLSYYWYAEGVGIVASLTSDGMLEELVAYKLNE